MKRIAVLFVGLALIAQAGPTLAADTVTAKDPDVVLQALDDLGYRASLKTSTDGWVSIELMISGLKSYIYFDNCDGDKKNCQSLLFNFGMDLPNGTSVKKTNEWNAVTLHGFTYIDDANDPWLAMAVRTGNGISAELFADVLTTWDNRIGEVKEFFDF